MPDATPTINERTSHHYLATFADEDGNPVVPEAITVRVDDEASGTEIRAEAAVDPAGVDAETGVLQLATTPAENRILDAGHRQEHRVVTVSATWSAGTKGVTNAYRYAVRNLKFRS